MLTICVGGLILADGLLIASYMAYDKLLMPSVFWGGMRPNRLAPRAGSLARPPSPAHWVLYFAMVRIWRWLFQPSIGVLALALACFATLRLADPVAIVAWLLAIFAVPYGLYKWAVPKLGFDD